MYRLAILGFLAVCSGFDSQHSFPCRRHPRVPKDSMNYDILLESLAQKVMTLDQNVKRSCQRYSNTASKEIVERNRYVVQTPLAGYSDSDIIIKIRYKALQINANNGDKHHMELRILPNFVDVAKAAYTLEDGILEVAFPFKEGTNTCGSNLSDSVTIVPKFDQFSDGQTGPRSLFP